MNSNFIDHIRIFCASGAGGNGSAHLRRAKYNPKGGPDGVTGDEAETSSSAATPACGHSST